MDPIIKEKWVKALRSGGYAQGRGGLYDEDTDEHCCLGVLCRVLDSVESIGLAGWLDDETREAAGLSTADQGKLINMNDSEKKSFPQIADYIEEHL